MLFVVATGTYGFTWGLAGMDLEGIKVLLGGRVDHCGCMCYVESASVKEGSECVGMKDG